MSQQEVAELPPVRPGRAITGMSAILLPFLPDGTIDWAAFEAHVVRTADAGLVPAVNMDTGYVQLLDDADGHRGTRSHRGAHRRPVRRRRVRRRFTR